MLKLLANAAATGEYDDDNDEVAAATTEGRVSNFAVTVPKYRPSGMRGNFSRTERTGSPGFFFCLQHAFPKIVMVAISTVDLGGMMMFAVIISVNVVVVDDEGVGKTENDADDE